MENPMLKLNPFYEKTKFCKKYVQLSETAKKFIEKVKKDIIYIYSFKHYPVDADGPKGD